MYNIITRQTLLPPFLIQNNRVDHECVRLSKKLRQLFRELVPEAFTNESESEPDILREAGVSPKIPDMPDLEDTTVSLENQINELVRSVTEKSSSRSAISMSIPKIPRRPKRLKLPTGFDMTTNEEKQYEKLAEYIEVYQDFIANVQKLILDTTLDEFEKIDILGKTDYLPTDKIQEVFEQSKNTKAGEKQFDELQNIIEKYATKSENVKTIATDIADNVNYISEKLKGINILLNPPE